MIKVVSRALGSLIIVLTCLEPILAETIKTKKAMAPIATGKSGEPQGYDYFDVPDLEPVMAKKYNLSNEASLQFSYMPVGAFNKYLALGGTYTRDFDDLHGWEVVNLNYALELESGLKKELKNSYGALENEFPVLKYLITTNYVYSPFYTKSILLNKNQVYSQLSFIGGGGVAGFQTKNVGVADVGLIQRFFYGERSSLKFDFRYIYFVQNDAILRNQLAMTLGWAFHFGGSR